jgi:DNA-binding response OmpR family regulator
MSGLEVCKKTRVRGLDRYIILLTAKNDVLDIEEGLGMGVDDYITKPFRKEELDIRIRAAMRILHLEKILKMPHNQTVSEKIAL